MLGRQHLTLSVATAGIWIVPVIENQLTTSLFFVGGVAIGSLIPDVDASNAAIFNNQAKRLNDNAEKLFRFTVGLFFLLIGYVIKYLVFKPLVIFLNTVFPGYHFSTEHRGFTHSWLGVLSVTLLTGLYVVTICELGSIAYWTRLPPVLAGYGIGGFLHLLQDSCTYSGVRWHQPFSLKRLRGSLDTETSSFRPSLLFYALLASIVFVYYWPKIGEPAWHMAIAIGISAVVWLVFMWLSRVKCQKA